MSREDAISILSELGLASSGLERPFGWNHEMWIAGDVVLRMAKEGGNALLDREVGLLQRLPEAALGPTVLASGVHQDRAWTLLAKAPGILLSEAWPGLSRDQRADATAQLAGALRALHTCGVEIADPVWRLHDITAAAVQEDLEVAARLSDADAELITDARSFLRSIEDGLDGPRGLVHSDAHFDNVLWDLGRVTCVLDFEYARLAPPDLDLDALHQFFSMPWLLVPEEREPGQRAALYAEAPAWLEAAYPELYAHERWRDR